MHMTRKKDKSLYNAYQEVIIMETITQRQELQTRLKEPSLLVYISSPDCSVCQADLQTTATLVETYAFPAIHIDITQFIEASGMLEVFSAPTVLLYAQGKEYHRQSRFIRFDELEKRIKEIKEHVL